MRTRDQVQSAAAAQVPTADYLPFGAHVSPTVIKLKGTGDYLAIWRLEGITFETADEAEIGLRKEGQNTFIRSLAGAGSFALWTHKVRRVVSERLDGRYPSSFVRNFHQRYNESLDAHRQMRTELYLSVILRRPQEGRRGVFGRLGKPNAEQLIAQEAEQLDILDDVAKQVHASFARYEPERLGVYERAGLVWSEMGAFLGFLVNGVWDEVPLRKATIAEYLPISRLHFGDQNGMLQIVHPRQTKFAGFIDFKEYPGVSEPGMTNGILYGGYEYVETQSLSLLNRSDAIAALDRQRGQLIASEDLAKEQMGIAFAMEQVAKGEIAMGEYHYSLTVFGASLEEVGDNIADARSVLQEGAGFTTALIDAIPEAAWFAQLPGNWTWRPREAIISSRNFASLSPFHSFARGKRDGNPWGEAIAVLRSPSGQPYYLNFHSSPEDKDSTDEKYPGNTFICGATGVGKSSLFMTLVMFATKVQGLRVCIFDLDRGSEAGVRAMGGKYFALKRGEPTGFQPFQMEPTEVNILFCERLVRRLVDIPGQPLSTSDYARISRAVRTVMSEATPHHIRCLSAVSQQLPSVGENSLKARLAKWTRGQTLGWVFDNPAETQTFRDAAVFGYDYTDFIDDPETRTPIMAYLLHITQSLIDGRPFIYAMEEFWKVLMDEMFSDFAKTEQKTIRKKSGLGIFVTQSPSDVLDHPLAKTMVEQCVTQIFLPNPRADHDDYVLGYKCTEAEFQIIASLGESSRLFLIKQGGRSAVVKLDLGGMRDVLDVISGTTDNVELLDQVRADVGDDPNDWLPVYHERIRQRRLTGARKETK